MYIVTIDNGGTLLELHGEVNKVSSGKVVKGVNTIDSFSFALLPNSPGFNQLRDFMTLVTVYNTNRDRYEFHGRVLYTDTSMDDSGLIVKEVVCESYFGFLCDSQQVYSTTRNWTVTGLLQHLIDTHNSQVEEYKHFKLGEVTVTDPNDNLYLGVQRENTWEAIQDKLIKKLGGEIRYRVEPDGLYLDYLTEIGRTSETAIKMSHNMKSIQQERNPSSYVTRLIPLGAKLPNSEERLDICAVNDGKNYIDDPEGIELYGLHVAYREWDDVTTDSALLRKGQEWMKNNNGLLVKYSITALDLSLLGLDVDDYEVHNWHPVVNPLLGIDDVARVIKKTIDICEPVKSTIEVGDNFQTFSDIQISQGVKTQVYIQQIVDSAKDEVKNEVSSDIKGGLSDGSIPVSGDCFEVGTIKADRVILTGAISWGDLNTDVQNEVNDAAALAGAADQNAALADERAQAAQERADDAYAGAEAANDLAADAMDAASDAVAIAEEVSDEFASVKKMAGGQTYIDGSKIYSNSIYADAMHLGGSLTIYTGENSTVVGGYLGYTTSANDGSAGMHMMKGNGEVVVTANGAKLDYGGGTSQVSVHSGGVGLKSNGTDYFVGVSSFYTTGDSLLGQANNPWGQIYSSNSTISTSDRNKKHSIEDLDDRYLTLFDNLRPCRFKFDNGTSDRYHPGFISQEVEDALALSGIGSQEFGGFVKDQDPDTGEDLYFLRYEEFIALLTLKIKQLDARLAGLEEIA